MEPVALGVRTPDMLERLSTVLGIRSQQQALQGQVAEVKSTQQSQRQREALANHDWSKYVGPDGTPDLNAMFMDPELRQVAGDQFQDVIAKSAATKGQMLTNMRTLTALRGDQRTAFGEMMNALRNDAEVASGSEEARKKINQAMVQFGEMYGEEALPVLSAYAPMLQNVPPGKLPEALRVVGLQAMAAGQQMDVQNPQYMNTGGQFRQINPNAAPGTPTSIAATLAPGQQDQLGTDPLGNPMVTYRDPRGSVVGSSLLPGSGQPGGPAVFGPGERQSLEAQAQQNFENVTANRRAASMAPQQLDQIDKALKLSRETATGSFASRRADIESALGSMLPTGFQGMDDASKLNELEKLTERIATDAASVLGVNARTDAERESIRKQNANIGYTPQAIQNVLQYAKAQTLAMQAKGDAQEAWLKREGQGITKQHEFETEFRQAYDPRVFQLAVMPAAERKKALDAMSKDQLADIQEKGRKLKDLGVSVSGR
jgi:hypothetical protein